MESREALCGVEPTVVRRREFIWLIVVAVLAFGGIRTERHQLVQRAPIDGELDQHSARRVTSDDIASLQDFTQQPLSLGHSPPRSFVMLYNE